MPFKGDKSLFFGSLFLCFVYASCSLLLFFYFFCCMKLEDRKLAFVERLRPYIDQYGREMLNDFFRYWSEHNEGGRKMRFEMQKIFNLKMRLITWHKKSQKYVRQSTSKDKNGNPIDALAYIKAAYMSPGDNTGTGGTM